jgi:hypothetical protein
MREATRRDFLGATGAALGASALIGPQSVAAQAPTRPKVAVLASAYHYLSHAYHIAGRFLDGFALYDRPEPYRPAVEVASLFVEQTPEATDLGRAAAARHGVRFSPTIADALTLGTGNLAVDGVLLIAEHGDYPTNEKLQKLYPRGRYFREVIEVVRKAGRPVPIFIDKHLSYDRAEAAEMVASAKALHVPLMAGSSLPVTWRLPALELPLGTSLAEALVVSRGEVEIFGFHALEALQCMTERRDRGGKPQGVAAVSCLSGEAVWEAGDAGRWPAGLLDAAVGKSHTRNPGDPRINTREFVPPPGRPTFLREPIAFLLEYADGLRAAALILNGHVDDTTIALRIRADSEPSGTLFYLPAPPGARFFDALVLRIEEFVRTRRPPYPVARTLLTGGVLDALLESRLRGGVRVETPDLAAIDYEPPADSGFIRTPLARAFV